MVYDDFYFSPFAATYGGLNPHVLIQVGNPTTFTLTFSQVIVNPYVALVSVGQPGYGVGYTFNGRINSMSAAGPNYWGSGSGCYTGNTFTGVEYNGVLQLSSSFSTLTVSTAPNDLTSARKPWLDRSRSQDPWPSSAWVWLALQQHAAVSRSDRVPAQWLHLRVSFLFWEVLVLQDFVQEVSGACRAGLGMAEEFLFFAVLDDVALVHEK